MGIYCPGAGMWFHGLDGNIGLCMRVQQTRFFTNGLQEFHHFLYEHKIQPGDQVHVFLLNFNIIQDGWHAVS